MSLAIFFSFYGKVSGADLTYTSQICPCLELSISRQPLILFTSVPANYKYALQHLPVQYSVDFRSSFLPVLYFSSVSAPQATDLRSYGEQDTCHVSGKKCGFLSHTPESVSDGSTVFRSQPLRWRKVLPASNRERHMPAYRLPSGQYFL